MTKKNYVNFFGNIKKRHILLQLHYNPDNEFFDRYCNSERGLRTMLTFDKYVFREKRLFVSQLPFHALHKLL